jgi:hypothetical protein
MQHVTDIPSCPRCGKPAVLVVGTEQAFCGNEQCRVLAWNPLDPESWEREHVIQLTTREGRDE